VSEDRVASGVQRKAQTAARAKALARAATRQCAVLTSENWQFASDATLSTWVVLRACIRCASR